MEENNIYNFHAVLGIMLRNIQKDYMEIKNPLARCELAKGYFEIGRYLYDEGVLPSEYLGESISRHLS